MRRAIVLMLLAGALALSMASGQANKEAEKKTRSTKPAWRLTAEQITQDYSENEMRADEKYRGSVVAVSGTIRSIGKGITDEPYVALNGVQCSFSKDSASEVARIDRGAAVTLKGVVKGRLLGTVMLRGCVVE